MFQSANLGTPEVTRRRPRTSKASPSPGTGASADLDLTGSPLRCSFTLDEEEGDNSFDLVLPRLGRSASKLVPLDAKEAR